MAAVTITLDLQGGFSDQTSISFEAWGTPPQSIVVPHYEDYKMFEGYYTLPNGQGDKRYDKLGGRWGSWTSSENETLYADWSDTTPSGTRKTAHLYLDRDSSSGTYSNLYKDLPAYDNTSLPWVQIPTKQVPGTPYYYLFKGFYVYDSRGDIQCINGIGEPTGNFPRTTQNYRNLYAKWDLPPKWYWITFDTNGGFDLAPDDRRRSFRVGEVYYEKDTVREGLSPRKTRVAGGGGSMPPTYMPRWGGLRGMNWGNVSASNYGDLTKATDRYDSGEPSPWSTIASPRFLGWYTEPVGGTLVSETDVCNLTGNITLYAHWDMLYTKYHFDASGGAFADGTTTKDVGFFLEYDRPYGELPIPQRSGYTFEGWFTLPKGMNAVELADSMYPNRKKDKSDDARALEIPRGGYQVHSSDNYPKLDSPPNPRFPFGGRDGVRYYVWDRTTSQYCNVCILELGDGYSENWTPTLYAHWTKGDYITLDADGGTGGTDHVTAGNGGTLPALTGSGNLPTKANHTFGGYYTQRGGQGTKYYNADGTAAATWPCTEDAVLYAKWEPITVRCTVRFANMDVKVFTCTVGKPYGPLPGVPSLYSPYFDVAFYSLSDEDDDEEYQVTADTIVTTTTDHYVYIWYWGRDYAINYEPNGGTLPEVYEYYSFGGEAVPLPSSTVMNDASHRPSDRWFAGWYLTGDFSGSPVTEITTSRIGDVTVYAKWDRLTRLIVLDANYGTVSPSSVSRTPVEAYGELPTPTRSGYEFLGWFTAASGGDKIDPNALVGAGTTITLYAHWRLGVKIDWWGVSFG